MSLVHSKLKLCNTYIVYCSNMLIFAEHELSAVESSTLHHKPMNQKTRRIKIALITLIRMKYTTLKCGKILNNAYFLDYGVLGHSRMGY